MKHVLYFLITTAIISACNNNSKPTTEAEAITADTAAATPKGATSCYAFKSDELQVTMNVQQFGAEVVGTLVYDFVEKDDNMGILKGMFNGDTLIADYAFKSEGITSSRQVAFIKSGNHLTEGYGDVEDKDGKTVFKNRGRLNYNGTVLTETPCKD